MNKTIYKKIAASIAILFSILTIVEGTQVLLDITRPEYAVLTPLLFYNVVMGFAGVVVGALIWRNQRPILRLVASVSAVHILVLLIVGMVYISSGAVALQSVKAMSIRSIVWLVIVWIVWKTGKSDEYNSEKR